MIAVVRQTIGGLVALAGVVLPSWAIFHLVRTPSCGENGTTCPAEVGLWIVALVCAVTFLIPIGVAVAGRDRVSGRVLLLAPVAWLAPLAFVAGIVVSLAGPSADPDTRWVGIVIGGVAAIVVLAAVPGIVRRASGATQALPPPATRAEMQALAAALEQLKSQRDREP
jgi:hypothetical protein